MEASSQDSKSHRGDSSFSGLSTPPTSNSSKTSQSAGGADTAKPKTTRSFSSGLLSGLSRRRSTVVDSLSVATNNGSGANDGSHKGTKSVTAPNSARLSTVSGQLPSPSDLKKTLTSELKTPTSRSSPSNYQTVKAPAPTNISNPIQPYPTGSSVAQHAHPSANAYGQSATGPSLDPKSPRAPTSSGVSPFPPLSPYAALKLYAPYLSLYERAEIGEYPQVYYVGQNCRHKKPASVEASSSNFGKLISYCAFRH